jgi:hypothetical protein
MKSGILRKLMITTAIVLMAGAMEKILMAETVFLKNGEIIEGTASSFSNDSIQIRTEDKKVIKIKNSDILRTLYTKLKKNKVFIQKRDGKSVLGFVIDEDQDTYTYRKELYSPEEFKLKKADILFMAEKNPSGLQAVEILPEKVSLIWFPPYDEVKRYNVYIKTDPKGKYELAGSSKEKKITLDKLKSNTIYYIIVTGVDKEDYESTPSNEITVNTKNLRPSIPANVICSKDSQGVLSARWEPSTDTDGTVTKYRIYVTRDKTRELLTDVTATEYAFTGDNDIRKAELVAVDNLGEESQPARIPLSGDFMLSVYPGMMLPLGKLGKVVGPGFGVTGSFALNNYFYDGLVTSIEAGFYSFMGKDAIATEYKKTKTVFMATLLLTAGFNFPLGESFTITPFLGAGIGYMYADYTSRDRITLIDESKKINEFGPLLSGGVAVSYRISSSLQAVIRFSLLAQPGSQSTAYAGCDAGCIFRI